MSVAFTSQPIRRGPKPRRSKPVAAPSQAAPLRQELLASASRLRPFTAEELSVFLWDNYRVQRSPRRLAQLRTTGGGPPYVRDGIVARYPQDLAIAWVERLLGAPVRSTAEESARRQLGQRATTDVPTLT
jgi:hypothetical protein